MDESRHILVIDDEPLLQRSMAILLTKAGFQVTTASNGDEAITALASRRYDLVFLDMRLPDISGIELLAVIHRKQPALPVVILTAHASLDTALEAVRYGARDYLIKPISPDQIIRRTHEILEETTGSHRRQELLIEIQALLNELQEGSPLQLPKPTNLVFQNTESKHLLRSGLLTLNLLTSQIMLSDIPVHLPPATFDYLVTLVRHSPNPVTYEALVQESQGYVLTRLEAREMAGWHIHQIRKALEVNPSQPRMVITVRNIGYRFVPA